MQINALSMGGASAGIIGSLGTDDSIINALKKSTNAFAKEYCRPTANHTILDQLSNEIEGFLQTLQLTNTLSEEKVIGLIDQLQKLIEKT